MSNPELMDALAALAADKGVTVDTLFSALADALETAYRRMPGAHEYAWVTIDPDSGEIRVMAQELDEDGQGAGRGGRAAGRRVRRHPRRLRSHRRPDGPPGDEPAHPRGGARDEIR